MSQLSSYETRVQDFLDALTQATQQGNPNVLMLAARFDIPAAEARSLAQTVQRLDAAFVEVSPSAEFREQLKSDLVGEAPARGVFGRVRNLPPRLQVAAAVALFAAMTLLGRRRLMSEARALLDQFDDTAAQDNSEVEVAAQ